MNIKLGKIWFGGVADLAGLIFDSVVDPVGSRITMQDQDPDPNPDPEIVISDPQH